MGRGEETPGAQERGDFVFFFAAVSCLFCLFCLCFEVSYQALFHNEVNVHPAVVLVKEFGSVFSRHLNAASGSQG